MEGTSFVRRHPHPLPEWTDRQVNSKELRPLWLAPFLAAGAACSFAAPEPGPVTTDACVIRELDRRRLTLADGLDVYVEPQAVGALADGFFVAGQPTYAWTVGASGRLAMVSSRGFLGVEVAGSDVVPIPLVPGVRHVGQVKAARPGPGRTSFLLEEVDRPSIGEAEPLRIVHAEYASGRWIGLEELPVPPGGRLAFPASSALTAREDGSLAWATPFVRERGGIDVLLYEYEPGAGWRWSLAVRDWADEVGLVTLSDGRLALGVGGLDPEFGSQLASIRAMVRDTAWSFPRRLDLGSDDDRFRTPTYLSTNAALDLLWLRTNDPRGTSEAWVVTGLGGADERAPARLDPHAVLASAVANGVGGAHILTYHADATLGLQQLRVHRRGAAGYALVGTLPYPFTGPFTALMTPTGELLVIGAEATPDPMTPSVRSLVIRLSTCT
jgi:hypothetical protein